MWRLPRMLFRQSESPVLLLAGNRLEAWRLVPVLRALRAAEGGGALLVDAGCGDEVSAALRELGMSADIKLPACRALTLALYRLGAKISPAMFVAGGASKSAIAAGLAARSLGVQSALLGSPIDQSSPWRWRTLGALFTWSFAGAEAPKIGRRTLQVGDPFFDLCREQAAATDGAQQAQRVFWHERSLANAAVAMREYLSQHSACIDWMGACGASLDGVRQYGAIPHWRRLALLRRAQVVVTDDTLTAFEARFMARPVLWIGPSPPRGCVAAGDDLPRALWQAQTGAIAARPLIEDGRAATRIAAHVCERIDNLALAGLLSRAASS